MNDFSPRQLIDDFVRKFSDSTSKLDHNQLYTLLESLLQKLNLVTREEFDAQSAVLARTRKRVQDLEMELANLELEIKNSDSLDQ